MKNVKVKVTKIFEVHQEKGLRCQLQKEKKKHFSMLMWIIVITLSIKDVCHHQVNHQGDKKELYR